MTIYPYKIPGCRRSGLLIRRFRGVPFGAYLYMTIASCGCCATSRHLQHRISCRLHTTVAPRRSGGNFEQSHGSARSGSSRQQHSTSDSHRDRQCESTLAWGELLLRGGGEAQQSRAWQGRCMNGQEILERPNNAGEEGLKSSSQSEITRSIAFRTQPKGSSGSCTAQHNTTQHSSQNADLKPRRPLLIRVETGVVRCGGRPKTGQHPWLPDSVGHAKGTLNSPWPRWTPP